MRIKLNYGLSIVLLVVSFFCNVILLGSYFFEASQQIVDEDLGYAWFLAFLSVLEVVSFGLAIAYIVVEIVRKESTSLGAHYLRFLLIFFNLAMMPLAVMESIVLINYMFGYDWSYR